jgi:hypothetical protein
VSDLTARERRKLQAMIDRTSKASAAFHKAQAELNGWCRERYGTEPGEIDADEIIDCVMGGCGAACGMDADDFHQIMARGEA